MIDITYISTNAFFIGIALTIPFILAILYTANKITNNILKEKNNENLPRNNRRKRRAINRHGKARDQVSGCTSIA